MPLRTIPTQFRDGLIFNQQEGERLDALEVVLPEKCVRPFAPKKIEQHQTPAAAVGRSVVVFDKGPVEQAGGFAAVRGGDPGAARLGVAGKQQHAAPGFLPGNMLRRSAGRFVAVVREDKTRRSRQKSYGAHTTGICCKARTTFGIAKVLQRTNRLDWRVFPLFPQHPRPVIFARSLPTFPAILSKSAHFDHVE